LDEFVALAHSTFSPIRGDAMPDNLFADLEFALPFVQTLEDLDVLPIHYYRVMAKCSIHGVIQSTWDEQPGDNAMLVCGQCFDILRRCPVFAFTEVSRPELSR
jgi:hypothetical protein